MLVNVTPVGAPTVAARAFVESHTWPPTAAATLLPLVGATATMAVDSAARIRQVVPPFCVCQRFWLPLT